MHAYDADKKFMTKEQINAVENEEKKLRDKSSKARQKQVQSSAAKMVFLHRIKTNKRQNEEQKGDETHHSEAESAEANRFEIERESAYEELHGSPNSSKKSSSASLRKRNSRSAGTRSSPLLKKWD